MSNTLSDGGFESGTLTCWHPGGIFPPVISTQQVHSGSFAAQLGANGIPVPNGDSSLYQTIAIPSNGDNPALSFWYWPSTSATIENEWQEAQIRDSNGNLLAQIFKLASNTQTWTQVTYDLTPYQGRTIQIYFNAHEDGYSGLTYMYLDDVSITSGGTPQALQFVAVTPCRLVDTRSQSWRRSDSGRHFPQLPHTPRGRLQHSVHRSSVLAECLCGPVRPPGISHHMAHRSEPNLWSPP